MFTDLDRIVLAGTRVEMTRYIIVDPDDDNIDDLELARISGHNELLQRLRDDSYIDVAEAIATY